MVDGYTIDGIIRSYYNMVWFIDSPYKFCNLWITERGLSGEILEYLQRFSSEIFFFFEDKGRFSVYLCSHLEIYLNYFLLLTKEKQKFNKPICIKQIIEFPRLLASPKDSLCLLNSLGVKNAKTKILRIFCTVLILPYFSILTPNQILIYLLYFLYCCSLLLNTV